MAQYILNLSKVQPGDIILERLHDRESELVMYFSKSKFSHAMLYAGSSSCYEALLTIVVPSNISRELYEDKQDVAVLRLKPEFYSEEIVNRAIEYVHLKVGTQYSKQEARRILQKPKTEAVEWNRQTCTRLVAQAFNYANVQIVENPDYCTPEDILMSDKLYEVENVVVEASSKEVEFANSESALNDQHDSFVYMFSHARELLGEDIQDENQLALAVIRNPEKASQVAQIVRDSGYLELMEIDKQLYPWQYDPELFVGEYGANTPGAIIRMLCDIEQAQCRFTNNALAFEDYIKNFGKNEYFLLMKDLWWSLVRNCNQRLMVLVLANQIYSSDKNVTEE